MTVQAFGFGLRVPSRPRVFVSYHHHNDRSYYDQFVHLFEDTYDVLQDASVDREIDSDDAEYVIRNIR
jgi:antiphage defense system Thoeris ThsB-like protein